MKLDKLVWKIERKVNFFFWGILVCDKIWNSFLNKNEILLIKNDLLFKN